MSDTEAERTIITEMIKAGEETGKNVLYEIPRVTRVEVIDHTGLAPYEPNPNGGRAYLRDRKHSCDLEVAISLQDDLRTLKVFVSRKRNETTSKKAASAAAKVLKDPKASQDAKTAAASALTQRAKKP